jgi:uncharacterized Fe-S cluster protein YjdI
LNRSSGDGQPLLRRGRYGILPRRAIARLDPESTMSDRRLQVYQTDQVRVTYDPSVCMHSGVCLRTMPAVFDGRPERWVQPENAAAEAVMAVVAKCPSGALRAQLVTSVLRSVKRDGGA